MSEKKIDDGGPAFPTDNERQFDHNGYHFTGMTLRDYFAAKALQGLLACPDSSGKYNDFAAHSYAYADAMIAQRAKPAKE